MKDFNIPSWFDKSTVKHLRLPFSFFLMPVFLFAVSQVSSINWETTAIAFVILHLLVFPSSNGYNSFQDRDTGSIGGLKHPPKVSRNLYRVTLLMDVVAVLSGFFISHIFSLLVFIFILASRAYSYRNVRLKQYPIIGFLTVFIFQGAFVYLMASSAAVSSFSLVNFFTLNNIICMSVASLFIGSVYPLTQIYQHDADKKDGVTSLSYKLGYNGTFVFSGILFSVATLLLYYYFNLRQQQMTLLLLFLILMLPVTVYLSVWFSKVRKNKNKANFENTMTMNLLTSTSMNLYFVVLIFNNYINWF
ncbi:UbiA family prenyltransferase [Natronoflexus pectinivorans]|uniref:1,4-dihydroxy-2-naphthoate octaprenyltransferase n=1 Tax=Natronoflexus pectinivorans TaxID=682526 RepID=A0A4R2GPT7_9BACT|nr:UbiA family prenyltransferase [Natronoflexus pectinivorans]TCO11078.1 1,4-dihydroxy-2-naphthoate octaprenyltransferase [Natronoflexus pectinivorans]